MWISPVTVAKNVTVSGEKVTGAYAGIGGIIAITGNVEVSESSADSVGVHAQEGGEITIDGSIGAPVYLTSYYYDYDLNKEVYLTRAEREEAVEESGYLVYTLENNKDIVIGIVRVKN